MSNPTIDIHLPSGLLIRDAAGILTAKMKLWPWDRFDGVPVSDPHTITDEDVDTHFRLGARSSVKRDAYKKGIRGCKEQISKFLRAISIRAAIEDDGCLTDLRKPIVGLYDCLTGMKGVKLANATKLTHRHRPKLLPVLDSALENYYWYSTSIRDEDRFLQLRRLDRGEYAFAILDLFREDLRAVVGQIDAVKRTVKESPFSDISRARLLESLIWYYYFGR
jgi:hypothetical protein